MVSVCAATRNGAGFLRDQFDTVQELELKDEFMRTDDCRPKRNASSTFRPGAADGARRTPFTGFTTPSIPLINSSYFKSYVK